MPQYIEVNGQTIEFPDNMPQQEIEAAIKRNMMSIPSQSKSEKEKTMLGIIAADAGNLAAGALGGTGSIGTTLITANKVLDKINPLSIASRFLLNKPAFGDNLSQIMKEDAERRNAITGALEDLGADAESATFKGGKLLGEIAGTAGTGGALANIARVALPSTLAVRAAPILSAIQTSGMRAGGLSGAKALAGRAIGGGVTGAASAALINPEDAGTGAAFGAALPLAMRSAGKIGRGISDLLTLKGREAELAKKAINEYKIPLGAADISDSSVLKATRSILNDLPVIGSVGASQKEAVQSAFNKAVGELFGAAETKLTPEVLDQAKKRMASEFNRIWGQNNLKVDDTLVQSLIRLEEQAKKLPKNEGASLTAEIKDIYSKMTASPTGELIINGDVANKFQSYLRRRAESATGLKGELNDLRQSILKSFNESVSPEDAAALALNRSQYKAYKTIEPLLNKGEAGVAGREAGDIPAALLPSAVASAYQKAGGTPIADLSKIGSKYLVDRVARTGGSTRAALQNSAIGAGLGTAAYYNPSTLLLLPLAYGINSAIGNPAIAKGLLGANIGSISPQLQQFGYQAAPAFIGR